MEWFCYVKGFFAVLFIMAEVLGVVFASVLFVWALERLWEKAKETKVEPVLRVVGVGAKWTFITTVVLLFGLIVSVIVYGATETVCKRGFWHVVSHPLEAK